MYYKLNDEILRFFFLIDGESLFHQNDHEQK